MQLHINGWQQHLSFSASHLIPEHQKCGKLHGHTYVLSCTISGKIPENSDMLIDFTKLKTILKKLTEEFDHQTLLPEKHPSITLQPNTIHITIGPKHYELPKEDCKLLPLSATTVETLAPYMLTKLIDQLDTKNLEKISLTVDEGLGQGATAEQHF